MPITTQQHTQLYARPRAVPQQSPTQTSSLLTKLPRELRDMIYEHVFIGESKIVIPHPMMQTSKQLQEEVAEAAARYLGPQARLVLRPVNKYEAETEIQMQYPNDPRSYMTVRVYKDWRSRPYKLFELGTGWQKLYRSHLGKRLLSYIRFVRIEMRMADIDTITINFRRDSAPKIFTQEGLYYSPRHDRSVQFYGMFQAIAERYREEKVGCSIGWVDAFMKETLDARREIGH